MAQKSGTSPAQFPLDSIRQEISSLPLRDSMRVELTLEIGRFHRLNDPDSSIYLASGILQYADSIGHERWQAVSHNIIGLGYMRKNEYPKALEHLSAGLEAANNADEFVEVANAYNNIAVVYLLLEQYDLAVPYLEKARDMFIQINDIRNAVAPNLNLGAVLVKTERYQEAVAALETSLELLKDHPNASHEGITYNNLGEAYFQLGEIEKSIEVLEKSIERKMVAGDLASIASSQLNLANSLIALKDTVRASALIDSLEANPMVMPNPTLSLDFLLRKKDLMVAMGKYEQALEFYDQYEAHRDSLERNNSADELSRLRQSVEIQSREIDIQKLERERAELDAIKARDDAASSRQRTYTYLSMAAAAFAGVLIIVLVWVNRRSRRLNLVLQEQNQQIEWQKDEIQQQNDALLKQNTELESLNREKDGLVSIVAHDLKAPLNKSLALSDMLLHTGKLDPQQQQMLQLIHKVNQEGHLLIQDLLDLNSLGESSSRMDLQAVDLKAWMTEFANGYQQHAARKQQSVQLELPAASPEMRTHPSSLGRVMDNLMSNALKFSPTGATVTLGARLEGEDVILWVQDQGPGFNPEDQQKLYGKFQKLSARPTGGETSTGLGLAIVQSLTARLGGRIRLASTGPEGSRFELRLPCELDLPKSLH